MDCSGCDVSSCSCVVDLSGSVLDVSGALVEVAKSLLKLVLPPSDDEEDKELCPICKKPWFDDSDSSDGE